MINRAYVWLIPLFVFIGLCFCVSGYSFNLVAYSSEFAPSTEFTTLVQNDTQIAGVKWYSAIKYFMDEYDESVISVFQIPQIPLVPLMSTGGNIVIVGNILIGGLNSIIKVINVLVVCINGLIVGLDFVTKLMLWLISLPSMLL